jgi:hypothetical protein
MIAFIATITLIAKKIKSLGDLVIIAMYARATKKPGLEKQT